MFPLSYFKLKQLKLVGYDAKYVNVPICGTVSEAFVARQHTVQVEVLQTCAKRFGPLPMSVETRNHEFLPEVQLQWDLDWQPQNQRFSRELQSAPPAISAGRHGEAPGNCKLLAMNDSAVKDLGRLNSHVTLVALS